MKLKELLKIIDNNTYLSFESNNKTTLGACYKQDFETTFKNHELLNMEIENIYIYKVKSLFSNKKEDCLCINFVEIGAL